MVETAEEARFQLLLLVVLQLKEILEVVLDTVIMVELV